MNKKIFLILILVLISFSNNVYAQDLCLSKGYTILTINGMFTDKKEAIENNNKLKNLLPSKYKNESITVDYLYNPSHLGGIGDVIDVIKQSVVESANDYDLEEMLDEASEKVKTQKLLLVGYSQGNFYANNIFDRIVDQEGGVPNSSLTVYSVATPDDHVSNGGDYLTSDTDKIIVEIAGYFKRTMKPNTHIDLKEEDGNGHSFSKVYLKYKNSKIIDDIKYSLGRLKNNQQQNKNNVCILPEEETHINNILDSFLPAVDYLVGKKVDEFIGVLGKIKTVYKIVKSLVPSSTASVASSLNDDREEAVINEEIIISKTEKDSEIDEVILTNNKEEKVTETRKEEIKILEEKTNEDLIVENTFQASNFASKKSHRSSSSNNKEEENILAVVEEDQVVNNDNTEEENIEEDVEEGLEQEENEEDLSEEEQQEEQEIEKVIIEDKTYVYDYGNTEELFSMEDSNLIMSLKGEGVVTLNVGDEYTEEGINLFNKNDLGDEKYIVKGEVDTSKTGINVIRYYSKKLIRSNYEPHIVRVINVVDKNTEVEDEEAPTITLVGEEYMGFSNNKGGFIEPGVVVEDNVDEDISFTTTGTFNPASYDEQNIIYLARDNYGNISFKMRKIKIFDYLYIPKYDFGTGNGDGRDWQAWFFNGSTIFDWSNKYVNNYLRQEFKIEAQPYPQFTCLVCMKRGIFTTNPLLGFNNSQFLGSTSLLNNPQNKGNGQIYKVVTQWDETGYTTTISHGDIIDSSDHLDVPNVNENMWVGWCSRESAFKDFPQGVWVGLNQFSQTGLRGGYAMVLMPYQVYDPNAINYNEEDDQNEEDESEEEDEVEGENVEEETEEDDDDLVVDLEIDLNTGETENATGESEIENEVNIDEENDDEEANNEGGVEEDPIITDPPVEDHGNDLPIIDDSGNVVPIENEEVYLLGYELNGGAESITVNPTEEDVSLSFTASKDVNWVSIKIENEEESSLYKMMQSNSSTCTDGSNYCSRTWDGLLSSGGLLKNGSYKVRIHMNDAFGRDYEDYIPAKIIVIGQ